ncbi:MAG: DPP IV N-terminal domain-containing protein, partial [Actinomycetota bacterium]
MAEDFLHRYATTQRFTLGIPRAFTISPDGIRVAFLRALAGDDPTTALWTLDVASGEERLVCDPRDLPVDAGDVPVEERARRERARERAGGIVAYATDRSVSTAAFAVGSALYAADLMSGEVTARRSIGPVVDPRPDPTGRRIAYASGGGLHVVDNDEQDTTLATEDEDDVTWGLAEFVAAEEMERLRGYWWSPEGTAILAARVDNRPVRLWTIADPANPAQEPTRIRYPVAGTANADVSVAILGLDGKRVDADWDREAFPYLARAAWRERRPPTIQVQSRDQRVLRILTIDPETGTVEVVREDHDEVWLDIVPGIPDWLDDGRLVTTADDRETRRLRFDDQFETPPGLQVRAVLYAGESVVVTASDEPTEQQVIRIHAGGDLDQLSRGPGLHGGAASDDVAVIISASLDRIDTRTVIVRGQEEVAEIRSVADTPPIDVRATVTSLGSRELRAVVLTPTGATPHGPLPVLMDPYGGPHGQRVIASRRAFALSQWFADQGFAVIVADGRGTPGRGPSWDRAVYQRAAETALDDQVDALHAAANADPRVDLTRVAIRGWSFGGELAAMAVLRRPDVFHAAVAGAPVTDQMLYDTHYTERYLG